jgi:hypothetical protein
MGEKESTVDEGRISSMNLTTEQNARFTSIINCFGDAFAQDHTDQRMHEWLAIIRNEMVDDWCVPVWHPALRSQLDWLDRVLDKIEARRKSTAQIVATNLRHMLLN